LQRDSQRNLDFLAGKDLVGILDDVLIGLKNPAPVVGVAIFMLGDLGQRVTRLDGVELV
jgi:hypothetical protein